MVGRRPVTPGCVGHPSCSCIALHVICSAGSGELEFEEFANLAAKFMVEEDTSMLRDELRQAFLLFDRDGNEECLNSSQFPF